MVIVLGRYSLPMYHTIALPTITVLDVCTIELESAQHYYILYRFMGLTIHFYNPASTCINLCFVNTGLPVYSKNCYCFNQRLVV